MPGTDSVVGVPDTTEDTALEAALAPELTALEAPLAALLATLLAALAPLLAALLAALPMLLAALPAALAALLAALPAALAADDPMEEALDSASLVASLVAEQLTANAAAMARPPTPAAARAILVFILGVLLCVNDGDAYVKRQTSKRTVRGSKV